MSCPPETATAIPALSSVVNGRRAGSAAPIIKRGIGWQATDVRVNLLDRFETSIERLMEGSIGRIFRQSLQPAQIGRKLEHAMIASQRAQVGSPIVANLYMVALNPADYDTFKEFTHGLCRQLESYLAEVADQRGYTLLDILRVELSEDQRVAKGNPVIHASIADQPDRLPPSRAQPVQGTQAFEPVSARTISLVIQSGSGRGTRFQIGSKPITIGRAAENEVVLDSPDVSRRHARLSWAGNQLRIEDLNSTNGTRVNGTTVRLSDLRPGDEVTLGTQTLTVESHDGPRGRFGRV